MYLFKILEGKEYCRKKEKIQEKRNTGQMATYCSQGLREKLRSLSNNNKSCGFTGDLFRKT